ncbi:uncharacterized protein MELLADRAFT_90886 [Melampsora larici-populina 98AG31]|uniref:U1-type domain-containing protein n=1 Tax=Melampsora larici-populina (strain 98AG31 / pathotype 3-4-7) TaxID=747676 RepID=F4R7W3_MELLP|nr:uncharacterized protein MELLADRAFT_90886 [Melampsora larici-populina 98AG31]EGG11717.1 hypothetical protein MELLADRAFT_90886 [Melampsora larici-populina 98AG31]
MVFHLSDIERVPSDPANPRFRCRACNTQGMANYEHHLKSATHQTKVQAFLSRLAAEEQSLVGLEAQDGTDSNTPDPHLMEPSFEPNPNMDDHHFNPPSPLSALRSLEPHELLGVGTLNHPNNVDDPDGHVWFDMLRQALENLEQLDLENDEDETETEEEPQDPQSVRARAQEAIEWHPFKNKEQVAGLLIIGSPRHLLSRAQYLYIRSIGA